jgi:hypothetical protein
MKKKAGESSAPIAKTEGNPSHDVVIDNPEIQVNLAGQDEPPHQDNPASPIHASTPPVVEEEKETPTAE